MRLGERLCVGGKGIKKEGEKRKGKKRRGEKGREKGNLETEANLVNVQLLLHSSRIENRISPITAFDLTDTDTLSS